MPLIPYPNIPNVPGVPALVRNATVPSVDSLANAAIAQVAETIFGFTNWGVYDQDGFKVIEPETFLGIDFKNRSHVATHPIEDGGFGSYNKVNTPYDCKIRMAIGGDETSRANFLNTCDSMLKSLDFYSVVTPEKTYLNAILQNYNYRRETRSGVTLLVVDFWFLEIRITNLAEQPIPAEPGAFDPVSGGQVQAATPSIEFYNPRTGETVGIIQ